MELSLDSKEKSEKEEKNEKRGNIIKRKKKVEKSINGRNYYMNYFMK